MRKPKEPTLSDQIRRAIVETGLTLKELADRTGVDQGALSRFVRHERTMTLTTADKLAPEIELVAQARRVKRKRS